MKMIGTREIIQRCTSIYSRSKDVYGVLASAAPSADLSAFWAEMAEYVEQHIRFWDRILPVVEKRDPFRRLGSLDEAARRLDELLRRVEEVLASCDEAQSVIDSFLVAYSLETCMVQPPLSVLPHHLEELTAGTVTPVEHRHQLDCFVRGFKEYCGENVFHESLVRSLERMLGLGIELDSQNVHDPTTGAINRRNLWQQIMPLVSLAQRKGCTASVLLIRVVQLEALGVDSGGEACDEMMKGIYDRIRSVLRRSDMIGRYDAVTLLLFLADVDQRFLHAVVERLQKSARHVLVRGRIPSLRVGGAYGVLRGELERSIQSLENAALDCLRRTERSRHESVLIEHHQPG